MPERLTREDVKVCRDGAVRLLSDNGCIGEVWPIGQRWMWRTVGKWSPETYSARKRALSALLDRVNADA